MAYNKMGKFSSDRVTSFETAENKRKPWTFWDKVTFRGATKEVVIEGGTIRTSQGELNPVGGIMPFAGSSAPTGYLLCDGAAVSRTTYATLFALVGTTYGAGDGSTTFNLPNLKGRTVVGVDASQTEFDTLGETGGAKTHTLAVSEMPSHNHGSETGTGWTSFLRVVDSNGTASAGNHVTGYSGGAFVDVTNTSQFPGGNHIHNIPSQGGGTAHNNLQPYIALNYIVRAL